MIKTLQIRNYAIIDDLTIRFSDGLTIITGETGAGKSILLGALGMIMGRRADTKVLYNTGQKCFIEGVFDVDRYGLQGFFETHELDYDPELVVRREITPSGKSRAFVNDTPVNLKVLQQLSNSLIDLHQQFDTLDIHNVSFQLRMVDALAANQGPLDSYTKAYRNYRARQRELQALVDENDRAAREMDFINFQLEEFAQIELADTDQEAMERELHKLSNAEDIKRNLAAAFHALTEDEQSLVSQMQDVQLRIAEVKKFDPRIEVLLARYESLQLELQDIAAEFESVADDTEYDGERIQEIQERLDQIYRLQTKHNVTTVAELVSIERELSEQAERFNSMDERIGQLEAEIDTLESKLRKSALQLRKQRQSVIPDFERRIHQMLSELSMQHAKLEIRMTELDSLNETGLDRIDFHFAANRGGRMQLIKDVASGGEVSRLTLVTKSLVASAIPLPTLIFDEIDSGVSGDVAIKMGNIMHRLSEQHQVVSITHSPQIASKADAHYFVFKRVVDDRTVTNVRQLEFEDRVRAIATMLSQSPPTTSALENARELLEMAGNRAGV